jgi:hypothetical protein
MALRKEDKTIEFLWGVYLDCPKRQKAQVSYLAVATKPNLSVVEPDLCA